MLNLKKKNIQGNKCMEMELAQEFRMQVDMKDICVVIQELDHSTCQGWQKEWV